MPDTDSHGGYSMTDSNPIIDTWKLFSWELTQPDGTIHGQVGWMPRPVGGEESRPYNHIFISRKPRAVRGELHSPNRIQQRGTDLSQIQRNQNDIEMLAIKVYLFFDLCYLNNYK